LENKNPEGMAQNAIMVCDIIMSNSR
jgi:hypothetical protein